MSPQVIAARVEGAEPPGPFVYHHAGDLATIGRKSAVVKLGVFQLKGFLGWVFWSVVHIYFLIGIRNRFVVALNWLWSYLTFQRGARLIGVSSRQSAIASIGIDWRSKFLVGRDLFGKPVATFPDHALIKTSRLHVICTCCARRNTTR